jgi:hypothetical protein
MSPVPIVAARQDDVFTSIMFLDIIQSLVHFLKNHNVSETGFCLRLQVKPTQLDPIDRASPYLRTSMSVTQEFHKIRTPQTICES